MYCSIAALGFATLEEYILCNHVFGAKPGHLDNARAAKRAGHMLLGVTMGYYLSLSKFCHDPKKCRSYFFKVALHTGAAARRV